MLTMSGCPGAWAGRCCWQVVLCTEHSVEGHTQPVGVYAQAWVLYSPEGRAFFSNSHKGALWASGTLPLLCSQSWERCPPMHSRTGAVWDFHTK